MIKWQQVVYPGRPVSPQVGLAARKRTSSGCGGAVRRELHARIHRPHPDAERAEDKLQIYGLGSSR
jgi:hypothetical protein